MIHKATVVAATLTGLYVVHKIAEFRRAVHAVKYVFRFSRGVCSLNSIVDGSDHPGLRTLLNTLGPMENFFPRIWGVTPGTYHMFLRKHRDFDLYGWDVITYVSGVCTPSCVDTMLISLCRCLLFGAAVRTSMSRTQMR